MIAKRELMKWLKTTPQGASFGIDEGGFILREIGGDLSVKIGGLPKPVVSPARKHTDNCGRTGTAVIASCKLDCACWCHTLPITRRIAPTSPW
jgi:hypothetical protein